MAIPSEEARFIPSRVLESRVAELLSASSLLSATSPAIVELYDEYRRRQEAALPPDALEFLRGPGEGIESVSMSLCDYLPITEELQDWNAFAAAVKEVPIESFLHVILNQDIPPKEIAALLRKPERATECLPRLSFYSSMSGKAIKRLFSAPEAFRSGLLDFIEANDTPVFRESLAEGASRAEARSIALRERLKTTDPLSLALEITKKELIESESRQSCTFIPSRFIGRKNTLSYWGPKLFVYFSVYPSAAKAKGESRALAGRLKVLGDATRLDILLYLRQGPSYCKELARWLDLSTATVSRQLDQLKELGLVAEDPPDSTNIKIVRLVPGSFAALYAELESFLESGSVKK